MSSSAPVPSSAMRRTVRSGTSASARSTTTFRPSVTSRSTCSWSTAAGSHARTPDIDPTGTPATAVSSAPQARASPMAYRSACSACGDPSTPTTIRCTGRGAGIGASSGSALPASRSGTTTVGQYACAGRADDTVPSSRSANPPRPRVPTTASRTVCDISTRTPAASPVSTLAVTGTPIEDTRCVASASTALAPSWIAVSSSAAYPPSSEAAVNDGSE